ncbi:MAG: sugar-binding domain-containing protein [Pirellulales bacterium]
MLRRTELGAGLRLVPAVSIVALCLILAARAFSADAPLMTPWAKGVTAENCWREYPRPQMTRQDWLNLNGNWDIAITSASNEQPKEFSKKILVPFPIESQLGGLRGTLTPSDKAWYRHTFRVPADWQQRRVLLHFGAVDWSTQVWVNGQLVGSHQGGYDPFTFDVTKALDRDGENELVVAVVDPTDLGFQPRGKQQLRPEGIWYTPVSGIWQTVWLEPVPGSSIDGLRVTPDLKSSSVTIEVFGSNTNENQTVDIDVVDSSQNVATGKGQVGKAITIVIPQPKLWSPAHPYLYDLRIRLLDGESPVDQVESYFGMRSISLGIDKNGITRIMLNGQVQFQYGALDQGYWPDGLYTPPSDEAMKFDLEVAKRLGHNMLRKHVKVEPARWYYWCDRMGLLVWQDMPSGDKPANWPADGTEINRSPVSAEEYWKELEALVNFCRNSPSVIVWIPFNEGWGQFDTERVTNWLKTEDPSRLVISASGGNDVGGGDVDDDHFYPGPGAPPAERNRAAVLGEFGGFGLPISGHTWQDEASWSYRSFRNTSELNQAYVDALSKLRPLIETHLSAAVFTQITDVEIEVNGIMTYDRKVVKLDESKARTAHDKLFAPLPALTQPQRIFAATIARWRFEDVEQGTRMVDIAGLMGAIAARDTSGHSNHLYAFSPMSAPTSGKSTYLARLKDSPSRNDNCMDDTIAPGPTAPVRDLFTEPNLSRTHMDLLNTYPFLEWTVEVSFAASKLGGDQAVVAKCGHLPDAPQPTFQLGVFGKEGLIELQAVDSQGEMRTIRSRRPAEPGKWYHVAATSDGKQMKLYLRADDEGEFTFQGQCDIIDGLKRVEGTWVVGRGFQDGEIAHDFSGKVDEVRICTIALEPSELMFAP